MFVLGLLNEIQNRGYTQSCRQILTTATAIKKAFTTSAVLSKELYVLGDPKSSVIAFTSKSDEVDIMLVGDRMGKIGWHLNALEGPAALHIACTVRFFSFAQIPFLF